MQLATWQSGRLQQTYADLLVHPALRGTGTLLPSDLYGWTDTQRDQQVNVYNCALLLPQHMVKPSLLMRVDERPRHWISGCAWAVRYGWGSTGSMWTRMLAAYQRCDNYALRCRQQIGLIRSIRPRSSTAWCAKLLGMLLRMSRAAGASGRAGRAAALERGFDAFKGMRGADEFVAIIVERGQHISQRIYAGDLQPFAPEEIAPFPDGAGKEGRLRVSQKFR